MYGTPVPQLPNAGLNDWELALTHVSNNALLNTLFVLIIADIITGISKSIITHTVDSSIGKKGLTIHFAIILLVGLLYPWAIAIGYQWLGDSILSLWIFMYSTSIVENIGQMGLPLPHFIKDRLNKFGEEMENQEPHDENDNVNKGDK